MLSAKLNIPFSIKLQHKLTLYGDLRATGALQNKWLSTRLYGKSLPTPVEVSSRFSGAKNNSRLEWKLVSPDNIQQSHYMQWNL